VPKNWLGIYSRSCHEMGVEIASGRTLIRGKRSVELTIPDLYLLKFIHARILAGTKALNAIRVEVRNIEEPECKSDSCGHRRTTHFTLLVFSSLTICPTQVSSRNAISLLAFSIQSDIEFEDHRGDRSSPGRVTEARRLKSHRFVTRLSADR
jgi:hypothetical protein